MKLLYTLLFALTFTPASAQPVKLKAYLDNKQFYAPGIGNYIEFHLQFAGYSIRYTGKDGGLIGEVGVRMRILKDDVIVQQDAYRLESPLMKDSVVEDFYDIKRFALDPGEYRFEIELTDMKSDQEPITASQMVVVEELGNAISLSDIEIVDYARVASGPSVFNKSGYHIIPRLSTFYPQELKTIPVYFEIYNTTMLEDSVFGIKRTIVDASNNSELEHLTTFTRHNAAEVLPYLRQVDISEVPSGKYIMNFTLINKNMTALSTQRYVFERVNELETLTDAGEIILDPNFQASITDDSVQYYLESLIPIAKQNETKNIILISKKRNTEAARSYIQRFWVVTAPENPYEEWIKYKAQIQLVERLYATNFMEGFETDRGRVYLRYGSPTTIVSRETSPTEYPYEIWQYNKIGAFSNKRFVFYNPDLVNNAYRLLHSDMVGELKNPSWSRELSKRNTGSGTVDDPNAGTTNHWGRSSDDLFRQY